MYLYEQIIHEQIKRNNTMKKEIVYTLPYEKEEEIKAAQALRTELYDSYSSVNVYPNGLYEVRIVATND